MGLAQRARKHLTIALIETVTIIWLKSRYHPSSCADERSIQNGFLHD